MYEFSFYVFLAGNNVKQQTCSPLWGKENSDDFNLQNAVKNNVNY